MAAYRKLVYETPGFTDYFFAATPIREIAELNIGSRPASRKATARDRGPARDPVGLQLGPVPRGAARLVRLRLGDRGLPRRGERARGSALALLQRMHRQWPFFRTLLSNLDMVLAKSDLAIAARYVELVEDKRLGKRIFARDRGRVAAHQRRADARSPASRSGWPSNPALARSIEHRFPYLDPLNHLQVELMRRYRAAPRRRAGDRAGAARHPHLDQRRRGGAAQHRLTRG